MNLPGSYLVVGFLSLLVAVALVVAAARRGRPSRPLTPLAGLAFALIVAGMVFGEARWLGYALIGAGVVAAVADAVRRGRRS